MDLYTLPAILPHSAYLRARYNYTIRFHFFLAPPFLSSLARVNRALEPVVFSVSLDSEISWPPSSCATARGKSRLYALAALVEYFSPLRTRYLQA